jgi:uncharacterized membrane protein YkvA (DUF1232 family)
MARPPLGRVDFGVIERLRLGWRLLRDPRVPAMPKWLVPAGALIYFLSPIDLIPDFILGLGQIDDLSVVAVAVMMITLLVRWSPQEIVDEHAVSLGLREDTRRAYAEADAARTGKPGQEPIEAKYWVDDWR